MITHAGGCHCGRVRFEVLAPEALDVSECNCSICGKTGFLHLIVPQERFKLLRDDDALATYTFNTGTARHLFCSVCGIKSFYVPRSHPDGRVAFLPWVRVIRDYLRRKAYDFVPRTVGEHIKKRRLEPGLSQRVVATITGLSIYSIINWETRGVLPYGVSIKKVSMFLGYEHPRMSRSAIS